MAELSKTAVRELRQASTHDDRLWRLAYDQGFSDGLAKRQAQMGWCRRWCSVAWHNPIRVVFLILVGIALVMAATYPLAAFVTATSGAWLAASWFWLRTGRRSDAF